MKMNRLLLFACLITIIFSCSKDDGPTVEQCATPNNIQVTNTTHNSIMLSWNSSNESATFTIEYGLSGFTQGSGTTISSTTTTTNISGLAAETAYDFYITADCGNNNVSITTSGTTLSTLQPPVVAQFLTNLSDLNIFNGDLGNLTPSDYAFEYDLITPLFTDYAYKQRLIALPIGTSLEYQDDGLPVFPDNTVISKTFYYNIDDRDPNLGKIIIETRILIKLNGEWETGNYKWNEAQTEATLTLDGHVVPTTYIDSNGDTVSLDYEIPSNTDCFTCHNINNIITPIGPKIRTLNFNGQLQQLIGSNLIINIATEDEATSLPNWEDDTNFTLDERARAYLDVNCAHCHQPGGDCALESVLDFRYETRFQDTYIFDYKDSIWARMFSSDIPEYGMPLIGTTVRHEEGFDLISEYVDSLN